LQEVVAAIERLDASSGLSFPLTLELPGEPLVVTAEDVQITHKAAEGWAGAAERGTQVAVDTRITEELKLAGYAREIVRHVQDLRKKANLEMEDRIVLSLNTDSPALKQAIDAHRDYIAGETLVREWAPSIQGVETVEAKIEGQALKIALRKA
jgi:isoleucyl-tRNA synthetase